MRSFEDYQDIASCMIKDDDGLAKLYGQIDRMVHLEWALPDALSRMEHIRAYTSDDPYKAVQAGTRALSSITPRLMIDPITVYKAADQKRPNVNSARLREKANDWERVLIWQWELLKRRSGSLLADIVASAIRYDAVRAQVIYLPYQIKSIEESGGNANRYKAARRYGDFAVQLYHPGMVHVRRSVYMTEEVLVATPMAPRAIVDMYGDKAASLAQLLDTDEEPENCFLFDMQSLEHRCVWAVKSAEGQVLDAGSLEAKEVFEIIPPEDNKYPFISWVCADGGTMLDSSPEHQHHPMLYPIVKSGAWENDNIAGTIMLSETIAEAAQPGLIISGVGADEVEVDYSVPPNILRLKPAQTAVVQQKNGLDPAKRELVDRLKAEMNEATVARVLVSAETGPGEAYSAFDLRAKIATRSLFPFRNLAQIAVGGVFETMLLWAHYTGNNIDGYDQRKNKRGKYYCIESDDIDPNCLYIAAELQEDVPTDRQQKINGASILKREGLYPDSKILEELGDTDPEGTMDELYREQILKALMQGKLQFLTMQASGEIQQLIQQAAQEMAQQQAQSQTEAPQFGEGTPQGLEGLPPEVAGMLGGQAQDITGGMGMPGVGGAGMAPPMGGQPPAMMNPAGNVREQQTGLTRTGEEV
jgi:hypothetical protein